MFKKYVLATSILTLSTLSNIATASTGPAPYLGGSMGITANTATSNAFGSYRGVPFNVFLGFGGVVYKNFFIAGELTGTLGTAEISNQGAVKTTYGYGASVLPGFEWCDHTIFFARLGVVRTHFPDVNVAVWSATTTQTGGQFGLGVQTEMMQNIDIRGEYDFIAYRSISNDAYSANPRSDVVSMSAIYKFA
jgi:opacity protein-like surface antigen